MPSNLELKARIDNIRIYQDIAENNGANLIEIIEQVDTYFDIDYGKLKLREVSSKTAELIYYDRHGEDIWQSDYIITKISDVKNLKKIFSFLFTTKITVRKTRLFYQLENARIHLDTVDNLGTFIEFEIVLVHGEEQAKKLFDQLFKIFDIQENSIIKFSYSDLLYDKII